MTWTYTDPSANTRDAIRFLVGDTNTNDQLVTDAEIAYISATYTNVYVAAAEICDAIAAKYARQADTRNGELSVSASQRAKAYLDLSKKLRGKATMDATIWVGGRDIVDDETSAEDTNINQPMFKRGMDDYDKNSDNDSEWE
jgi:hypothetical protein